MSEDTLASIASKSTRAAIRAPTGLGQQRTRVQSLEQLADLGTRERAVQRRIAGKPLARAGEKHHDCLGPVRHPDRNTIAAYKALGAQVGSNTVDPALQFLPRQPAPSILQGNGIRPGYRMPGEQSIERIRLPHALLVVAPGLGWVMQREERAHR